MSIDRDRERDRGGDGERKGAPNVEGLFTLKVDNISFRTTADILREEFKRFGSLGDVYLPRNYSTNEPRGFAFVRFVNREDGEDALRSMDGKNIDGRDIRIQEAKERRAENPKEHMVGNLQDNYFLFCGRNDHNRQTRCLARICLIKVEIYRCFSFCYIQSNKSLLSIKRLSSEYTSILRRLSKN